MNKRDMASSLIIEFLQTKRILSVLFASTLMFGCASPGSLKNVKYPNWGNYAFQLDFDSIPECTAMAERLEPFFRQQADARVAERTFRFAECTGMSISNQLIYQGTAEVPGIAKSVRLYSATRVLCEDAAAVLGIKDLRTACCRTHTSSQIATGPLLQIKERGIGTVLAELPMRTREDCLDTQILKMTLQPAPLATYMFWCVLEQLESPHLAQEMLVQHKPDRFKEGRIKMRVLDQRRCRELERVELLKAIRFEAVEGCTPVAKPM